MMPELSAEQPEAKRVGRKHYTPKERMILKKVNRGALTFKEGKKLLAETRPNITDAAMQKKMWKLRSNKSKRYYTNAQVTRQPQRVKAATALPAAKPDQKIGVRIGDGVWRVDKATARALVELLIGI